MTDRSSIHYVTVATRSYLPAVAVLARSLVDVHPNARLTCYLAERETTGQDNYENLFKIIPVSKLKIPDFEIFVFQYGKLELCCALKPYVVLHQLRENEAETVVYIDSDMRVYCPFEDILKVSLSRGSVVLTPHLHTQTIPPDYLFVLRSGICNAGFMAFKNNDEAKNMLHWWSERVKKDCIGDTYAGLLYDQRWLDLAIGLFPFIYIERYPGINVAYWNLHEKSITSRNNVIMVDDKHPLCIYHFSGISEDKLSRYQNGGLESNGSDLILQKLAADYRSEIGETKKYYKELQEYTYGTFDDGSEISPEMREIVRLGKVKTQNPFNDKQTISNAMPENDAEIWMHRITYLVDEGLRVKGKLQQLRKHIVLGRIWRFWRKWINPNL